MTEMVERVARAHVAFLQKKDPETLPWEHADEDMRDAMRELARETIAAMREPTDEMCEAGQGVNNLSEQAGHFEFLSRDEMADAWQAMIDEALK